MTEQELKAQRNRAKANLELLQMKLRSGLVTAAAVAEAESIYKALVDYRPEPVLERPKTSQPAPAVVEPASDAGRVELPAMPVSEFTLLMEQLATEKAGYHTKMAKLCNTLKDIPDHVNAKEVVDEIDRFYDLRNGVAVKMQFLKANGRLPQDEGNETPAPVDLETVKLAFLENLPSDKYELSKKLQLALPNLSKARTNLQRAKDPVKRQHYAEKVAKLEIEVGLIRSAMKGTE